MEEEFIKLGNRIKEMRRTRNITQKKLAEELDISITNMSNIETGKTAVTMQNLFKMKNIFRCEMQDFFVNEAEQKQPTEELPESIDLQDAINLLRLLRRIDIKGI